MVKTMTPKKIKHAMDNKNLTQAMVAANFNVSRSAVNQVIEGNAKSHRIRCYIADFLGLPVDQIWKIKTNPSKRGPRSQ